MTKHVLVMLTCEWHSAIDLLYLPVLGSASL